MPNGQVLEFDRVTKRFGSVTAIGDLSVRVEPGRVTGFLGPNGAGKTTSLRIMLGQIRPSSGSATIGGQSYSELRHPLRTIGAVLEESIYRPRRTAARQLTIASKANGIPLSRVDEVLRMVGLQDDADTRLGSYSLGMRQRLAVAGALLGDPGVLVLDEPANGLDPEGIRWMRLLMRRLADEGRTVLLSSHVLSEIEQVADDVVVLSKGRAVYSGGMDELADPVGGAVIVDAANRAPLITALSAAKLEFDVLRSGVTVRNSDSATVGAITTAAGVPLTMLQQRGPSLEEVFLDLVYGRRADSPRLDEVANPVAHATPNAEAAPAASAALAGAAAAVADGGAVAAAGVGYGTTPIDVIPDADDAAAEGADGVESTSDAAAPAEDAPSSEAAADDVAAGAADAADAESTAADAPGVEEADAEAGDVEAAAGDAEASTPEAADETTTAEPEHEAAAEPEVVDAEIVDADADDAAESAEPQPSSGDADDAGEDDTSDEDAAIAALWAPRSASGAESTADSDSAADAESADAESTADTESTADAERAADSAELPSAEGDEAPSAADGEPEAESDESRPTVLPLATEAVAIPVSDDLPTFTELITGLPASVAEGIGEPSPATEAIPVFNPVLAHDDDDEDAFVDDTEDDPRLAAMRTSLSSAASRFFDGPAPDYPYNTSAPQGDSAPEAPETAEGEQSEGDESPHPEHSDDSASEHRHDH